MLHEQAVSTVTPVPTTSIARNFPTSVLLQEQREEIRPLLNVVKEDRISQVIIISLFGIKNFIRTQFI